MNSTQKNLKKSQLFFSKNLDLFLDIGLSTYEKLMSKSIRIPFILVTIVFVIHSLLSIHVESIQSINMVSVLMAAIFLACACVLEAVNQGIISLKYANNDLVKKAMRFIISLPLKYLPTGLFFFLGQAKERDEPGKLKLILKSNAISLSRYVFIGIFGYIYKITKINLYVLIPTMAPFYWLIGKQQMRAGRNFLSGSLNLLNVLANGFALYSLTARSPFDIHFLFEIMIAWQISWVIGFMSFISPGGLGVRDAILYGYLRELGVANALLIVAAMRILQILVEVVLSLTCWLLAKRFK